MDTRDKVWDWITLAIGVLVVIAAMLSARALMDAAIDHRWGGAARAAGALLVAFALAFGVHKWRDRLGLFWMPWENREIGSAEEEGPR